MEEMFGVCISLKTLPDISNWNTSKNKSFIGMFYKCQMPFINIITDISKWDFSNVEKIGDFHGLFQGCSSLISLPDISKWNTSKIKSMDLVFCDCTSLISLPDISKWDISSIKNMDGLFYNCFSLISIPDIAKWIINYNKDNKYMFKNCLNLLNIPSKFIGK